MVTKDKTFTCELRRNVKGKLEYRYVEVEAIDIKTAREAAQPYAVGDWWVAMALEKRK